MKPINYQSHLKATTNFRTEAQNTNVDTPTTTGSIFISFTAELKERYLRSL